VKISLVKINTAGDHVTRKHQVCQPVIIEVSGGDTATIVQIFVSENVEVLVFGDGV
jgi:hypothetical protein